jgi:hypothetical protein
VSEGRNKHQLHSGLENQLREEKFQLQTEKNLIEEQRLLIDSLEVVTSYYVKHHGVDIELLLASRQKCIQQKCRNPPGGDR